MMSDFAGLLALLMVAVYGALTLYIPLGGWRIRDKSRQARLLWLLANPVVLFVAFWFSGLGIWSISWWLWFGDTRPPNELIVRTISGGIAIALSAIVLARMSLGHADRRYVFVSFWGAVSVLTLLLSAMACDFVSQIDGWTARGAAESRFQNFSFVGDPFVDPTTSIRVIEEPQPAEPQDSRPVKTFVICHGNARLVQLRVVPYGWWWWQIVSQEPLMPSMNIFEQAEMHWETDAKKYEEVLDGIVRDYPNSEASKRAAALLRKLHTEAGADDR